MSPSDGIRGETIASAFQRRADRGDPGDLHLGILAATATTAQQRSWRARIAHTTTRAAPRIVWLAILLAATLLVLGLLLVVGGRIQTTQAPVEYLWSAQGGGDGMYFALGSGGTIDVDPEGRIWVADSAHDRFAIFDAAGHFIEYWGSVGTGDERFHLRLTNGNPYGAVAFAPDGTFYVLDAGNHRVQQFDRERHFVRSWNVFRAGGTLFQQPSGIAVDASGTVYVLRDGGDVVERYDSEGVVVGSFSLGLSGVNSTTGMAVDAQGNVYVAICCLVADEIRKYDPTGVQVATFGHHDGRTADQWMALRVATDGRLFATRGPLATHDKVYVFDTTGELLDELWCARLERRPILVGLPIRDRTDQRQHLPDRRGRPAIGEVQTAAPACARAPMMAD